MGRERTVVTVVFSADEKAQAPPRRLAAAPIAQGPADRASDGFGPG